jgi:nicotinamide riboside kinase
MARALAEHYAARGGVWSATRWVPEWARGYCARKFDAMCEQARRTGTANPKIEDMPWESAEFTEVAIRQTAEEDAAARDGSPVLFCDTDALATSIWHERYLRARSARVERVVSQTHHHLWLLTDHEGVPFEQDGTRDGEHIREWMSERFKEELRVRELPHVILTGPHEARLEQATAAVDAMLAESWRFADPL